MSKFLKAAIAATLISSPLYAAPLGLGRDALPEEVAAWNIDVRPDGQGLPAGRGTVADGEVLFSDNCAVCHGEFGEAVDRWPVLAGGQGSLKRDRPNKTIGSYWPYLSTVFDYVHRAMPFGNAQSLEPDQVYAITAYLLYLNDIVPDDFELNSDNFTSVKMPNADAFYMDDRAEVETAKFSGDVCMENCKDTVEITARAEVVDVTPEETAAKKAQVATAEAAAPAVEAAPAPEATAAVAALDPALVAAGETVFKKCKACHQVGEGAKNRVGPVLTGVVGHTAGQVEGFKYSKTLSEMGAGGLVWDDASLSAFLENPRGYVEKTKMSFAGLKKEEDRAAVIAYLKSFSQ
jgi:cytochrome c